MFDKAIEKAMVHFLSKFDKEPFLLRISGNEYKIGEGDNKFVVNFKEPIPAKSLMESTSIALGEAYMDGNMTIEGDLFTTLRLFLAQKDNFSSDHNALKKILKTSLSKKQQSKDVRSHYDIGNDFYKMWLDDTMCYSCAYFATPEDTLYQAQVNKLERLLKKLYLKPGLRLLDIGCGWGGLIIRAAKEYGVKALGITLSEEQFAECQARIKKEGLEGQVEVRLMDYRDLPKSGLQFDRAVSVGMLEHVGRDNYQLFNDCVRDVLVDGGLFCLHYISSVVEHESDEWIKKYIFPGGQIPSLREIVSAMANDGFDVLDVENLRRHYANTLLCWLDNYTKRRDEVVSMFDERFARMWELYLASCAAMFYVGRIDLHQILAVKGVNNDLPITRWY